MDGNCFVQKQADSDGTPARTAAPVVCADLAVFGFDVPLLLILVLYIGAVIVLPLGYLFGNIF